MSPFSSFVAIVGGILLLTIGFDGGVSGKGLSKRNFSARANPFFLSRLCLEELEDLEHEITGCSEGSGYEWYPLHARNIDREETALRIMAAMTTKYDRWPQHHHQKRDVRAFLHSFIVTSSLRPRLMMEHDGIANLLVVQ